ncbi:MAG TPA: hypothetical protein DDX39_11620 [Bacteroidales bacterium]|nr:MAG: hypothetical protein A2W98_14215 [Bacteroidetes bacterium GWF2_33_38]HBF89279.1 hypothetical protein [Bacteroidales bacterium]
MHYGIIFFLSLFKRLKIFIIKKNKMFKKSYIHILILLISLVLFSDTNACAQRKKNYVKNQDTHQYRNTGRTRYVLWLIPSRARRIHGVAIGLVNPCSNHDFQSELTINGISIEIMGQLPIIIKQLIYPQNSPICHSNYCKTNGIALGLSLGTGEMTGIGVGATLGHSYDVNGIFMSPILHVAQDANGLIAGLMTRVTNMTGFQVGVFTKNKILKGLQVGFFNRNRDYAYGSQVGVINNSEDLKGVQLGLININKTAKIKVFPFFSFSL